MRPSPPSVPTEMRRIGLRYVADAIPGISRSKNGKRFSYENPNGSVVSEKNFQRILSLVIPPAWTDVWICPFDDGHLQATGRDARGRKQYRYHNDFRLHQDSNKFSQITEFALAPSGLLRKRSRSRRRSRPRSGFSTASEC